MTDDWFSGFESQRHQLDGVGIHARTGGLRGAPPLLLLHGFPQTHVMWHRVAQQLATEFELVLPDLRGYGDSDKPPGATDHANYSKRAMAADLAALMRQLGHPRYAVCGHDRGARVAHRLALDQPDEVTRLCLIDIAPTLDMYAATDQRFASAYYHWFHLIQPHPLPEKMIGGCARDYLHAKLGGWGAAGLMNIEPQALAEYERCFCDPAAIHAACEDYRASAGIDLEHDRASRAVQQQIVCDLLVLWGEKGVIEKLFDPMALWRAQCAGQVEGHRMPAGHFIPEALPTQTSDHLRRFLSV
ncbi:MAG: alpha/beta hydrolase [Rubrivivax sp.]